MSHVDDGELTAYADGAYPANDPAALRIGEHLSTCGNCRTRLELSEGLRARASEILAYATPLNVNTPAFETLQTQAIVPVRTRRRIPLAWAASIILAVGLGWFGRGAWTTNPAMQEMATRDVANETVAQEEQTMSARTITAPPVAADQVATAPARQQRGEVAGAGSARDAVAPEASMGAPAAAPPPSVTSVPSALALTEEVRVNPAVAELAAADLAVPQIEGLPVTRLEMRGDVTIVDQTLPDGKLVRLTVSEPRLESRAMEADMSAQKTAERRERAAVGNAAAAPAAPAPPPVTVRRGTKLITINANLSPDSLRALAEKIK